MMNKQEICGNIDAVCKSLDSITVTGVKNAGNIAGCYSVLQEVLSSLLNCEIIPPDKKRDIDGIEKEEESDG